MHTRRDVLTTSSLYSIHVLGLLYHVSIIIQSDSVYRRRTDNTMAKRKGTNNDLLNIHIKLKTSNTNPTETGGELRCSGRVRSSCSTCGTVMLI